MPYKGRNLDSTSRTFFTNVSSISNGGHQRRESTDPSEPRSEGSASSRTAVKFSATEHLDLEAIDLRDQTDDSALEGAINDIRRPEEIQRLDSFQLFPKLPKELRLMIWEHTWPAPRVIEAAIEGVDEEDHEDDEQEGEGEDDDEEEDSLPELTLLRLAGSLSAFLECDFGHKILEEGPVEECPLPVALRVCHESRQHTLTQYILMQHAQLEASFYFNPYRDSLWFSMDFTDEPRYLRELKRYYGGQLGQFRTVLVDEGDWTEFSPAGYILDNIAPLGGVKTVQVVYGDHDEDKDTLMVIDAEELHARADEHRAEFVEFLKIQKSTVESIQYMDRSGRLY